MKKIAVATMVTILSMGVAPVGAQTAGADVLEVKRAEANWVLERASGRLRYLHVSVRRYSDPAGETTTLVTVARGTCRSGSEGKDFIVRCRATGRTRSVRDEFFAHDISSGRASVRFEQEGFVNRAVWGPRSDSGLEPIVATSSTSRSTAVVAGLKRKAVGTGRLLGILLDRRVRLATATLRREIIAGTYADLPAPPTGRTIVRRALSF